MRDNGDQLFGIARYHPNRRQTRPGITQIDVGMAPFYPTARLIWPGATQIDVSIALFYPTSYCSATVRRHCAQLDDDDVAGQRGY